MAIFTIDELTAPLSRNDVKTSVYNVLGVLGIDVTTWEAGAVTRTLVTAFSAALASLSTLQADIARSGFLDLAEADWLKRVAEYVYGVDYIQASFATGQVTLDNSTGGGLYIVAAGDLVIAHAVTGKLYRNTSGFTLNPLSVLSIAVQAEETGSASTAATGTLTTLVTPLGTVTCTNAAALIGTDEESDAALRVRCREKLGSLSPLGPWDAYAYAARNATLDTGESAGITRTRATKDGYGNVTLYVASASGGVTGAALTAAGDAVEQQAVPLAVAASTVSANELAVQVTYSAWVYNTVGLTSEQVKQAVESALAAFFAALPLGGNLLSPGDALGYVYRDQLLSVIDAAVPQIFHVVLTQPAADVALTNDEVATLVHDIALDATITQVSPPDGTVI